MVTIYNTPLSTTSENALFGRPGGDQKVLIDLEVTLFLCLLASERGPFLVPSTVDGAREGAAGDKFRVSGTKEMVEGAGANKESGGRFGH